MPDKYYKFLLDFDSRSIITWEGNKQGTLSMNRILRAFDLRRSLMEHIDTPLLSADSEYSVRLDNETIILPTFREWINWGMLMESI